MDAIKRSCMCIIFGLYCRPFLAVGLCVLHKCIILRILCYEDLGMEILCCEGFSSNKGVK